MSKTGTKHPAANLLILSKKADRMFLHIYEYRVWRPMAFATDSICCSTFLSLDLRIRSTSARTVLFVISWLTSTVNVVRMCASVLNPRCFSRDFMTFTARKTSHACLQIHLRGPIFLNFIFWSLNLLKNMLCCLDAPPIFPCTSINNNYFHWRPLFSLKYI